MYNMTDQEAIEQVKAALEEIRDHCFRTGNQQIMAQEYGLLPLPAA